MLSDDLLDQPETSRSCEEGDVQLGVRDEQVTGDGDERSGVALQKRAREGGTRGQRAKKGEQESNRGKAGTNVKRVDGKNEVVFLGGGHGEERDGR